MQTYRLTSTHFLFAESSAPLSTRPQPSTEVDEGDSANTHAGTADCVEMPANAVSLSIYPSSLKAALPTLSAIYFFCTPLGLSSSSVTSLSAYTYGRRRLLSRACNKTRWSQAASGCYWHREKKEHSRGGGISLSTSKNIDPSQQSRTVV